jgi:hypothetical protein
LPIKSWRVCFIFVGRWFLHDVARASSPCKHGQDGRATFFTYKREAHPELVKPALFVCLKIDRRVKSGKWL